MERRKSKDRDILQIILKPFLYVGYIIMLSFGFVYYFVYALIIKILKKNNYYGDIKGFMKSVKSIVFSGVINEHRNINRQRSKIKRTRKQSAEYMERPKTRMYHGNRATTRADIKAEEITEQKPKNHTIKRIFEYAKIFFLNEEIRKEKAKEIEQKYPRKNKVKEFVPEYSKAANVINDAQTVKAIEKPVYEDQISIPYHPKRSLLHKRIITGSVAAIFAFALVFVGALAYAQELPDNLNFISPKPTANLFEAVAPIEEEQYCEIAPENEQSVYMVYPDQTTSAETNPESSAEVITEEMTVEAENAIAPVSGTITTEAKIFREGDEDPEVAKIQARLMELHYMSTAEVTEYYGKNTKYAMGYFQRQHGLQSDGTAGAETLEVLYSAQAQDYKVDEGTEGADVEEIQKRLYDLDYLSSSSYVTGYFGTKTLAAVKDFQETNGLSADGVVGYYTYNKLFSYSAIKNSTSSSSSSSSSSSNNTGYEGSTGNGSSASDIVDVAKSLYNQGYIYVWGGKNPDDGGFDCSGYVYYVLNRAGFSTGYRDTDRWATTSDYTTIENMDDVQPGDVLVFSSGHVGIYIGGGKMIHSTRKGSGDLGGIYIDNFFTDYRESVWIWGKRIAD